MKYLIKEMPTEERPRERLLKYGAKFLSTQELLAILLVTGTKKYSVLEVANRILSTYKNIDTLNEATIEELMNLEGIGQAKAISLLASIELGKRIATSTPTYYTINHPIDAYNMLEVEMRHLTQENLLCLYLNIKSEVISTKTIAIGTINSTLFDARSIFKWALKLSASFVIVVHNHPSGDPTPSQNDDVMTEKILEVSKMLGIEVVDHIIIGKGKYYSYLEHNKYKLNNLDI